MELRTRILGPDDRPVAYAILALAGEHMARVQGMTHWYPFPPSDVYAQRLVGRTVYGVTADGVMAGSFDLSESPEVYHDLAMWPDGDVPAMYFGGFGVLPSHWGRGIGRWAIAEAERMAHNAGHTRFRFDAISSNQMLLSYYEELGFSRYGEIAGRFGSVTCFERLLD